MWHLDHELERFFDEVRFRRSSSRSPEADTREQVPMMENELVPEHLRRYVGNGRH